MTDIPDLLLRAKSSRRTLHRVGRAAAASVLLSVSACDGAPVIDGPELEAQRNSARGGKTASKNGTFYGATVRMGNGRARTYLTVAEGRPVELGIAFTEEALQELPPPHDDPHHYYEYLLPLPPHNSTPYRLVEVDWNPTGHPDPTHVYDKPHLDFHFYTISKEERNAITPDDPRFEEKGANLPGPEFVPQGYIVPAPIPVPRMGVHWIDTNSPELHGKPWTTTLLIGSWDGEMIFLEPMITTAFLRTKPDVQLPVPQPQRYAEAGHYPSTYRVRWDPSAREYRVSLGGFAWRD